MRTDTLVWLLAAGVRAHGARGERDGRREDWHLSVVLNIRAPDIEGWSGAFRNQLTRSTS